VPRNPRVAQTHSRRCTHRERVLRGVQFRGVGLLHNRNHQRLFLQTGVIGNGRATVIASAFCHHGSTAFVKSGDQVFPISPGACQLDVHSTCTREPRTSSGLSAHCLNHVRRSYIRETNSPISIARPDVFGYPVHCTNTKLACSRVLSSTRCPARAHCSFVFPAQLSTVQAHPNNPFTSIIRLPNQRASRRPTF